MILIEPKNSGNIGAVARGMKNFGKENLVLINPCEIDEEAYKRAKHGRDILKSALILNRFDEIFSHFDYLAATTGISDDTGRKFRRVALDLKVFKKKIEVLDGRIGIVFGREDYGLYNREIERCDTILSIPTTEKYPVLNLSHAVIIILYELFSVDFKKISYRPINSVEREALYRSIDEMIENMNIPAHKKGYSKVMCKRILGRAVVTEHEFWILMGVIKSGKKCFTREK